MTATKAISLWQPWAHLIAIGAKRYETRSWKTSYRGPMAIHAGRRWTYRMFQQCWDDPFHDILRRAGCRFRPSIPGGFVPTLDLDFGAIIAIGELIDIVPTQDVVPQLGPQEVAFGDFRHDRYAWLYEHIHRLPEPIPWSGRQGIFNLSVPVTVAL